MTCALREALVVGRFGFSFISTVLLETLDLVYESFGRLIVFSIGPIMSLGLRGAHNSLASDDTTSLLSVGLR